jgi:hypothetical protein
MKRKDRIGEERRGDVLFHLALGTVSTMALTPGESGLKESSAALLCCSRQQFSDHSYTKLRYSASVSVQV